MHSLVLLSLLAAFVFPSSVAAQESGTDQFVSDGSTLIPVSPGKDKFAWWSGEALLLVENREDAPVIRVFDREAKEVFRFSLTIPEAAKIMVVNNSLARGSDGMLAVVGRAFSKDSRGSGFLALVSADGQEQTIVQLYPFWPHAVTVAADGTIWVQGTPLSTAGPTGIRT